MKEKLREARKKVVRWKIYIDRAKMYINYINFIMIIFVFVDTLKEYEFTKSLIPNSSTGLIILIPVFLAFSLFLGYLDTKLGFRGEEAKQNSLNNPINREILERLDKIEKRIK